MRKSILAATAISTVCLLLFVTAMATAQSGLVLALDGANDYANAADNASLDLGTSGGSFTIEAFVYMPNVSASGNQTIAYKNNAYAYYYNLDGSTANFFFRFWFGSSPIMLSAFTPTNSITPGWHHLAFVWENTSAADAVALYMDGRLLASNTIGPFTPGIDNSSSPLGFGSFFGGGTLNGFLDDVRLSGVARYHGADYVMPTSPIPIDANTRALWHFDEAAGSSSFADASGNGNTLAGSNGAQTVHPLDNWHWLNPMPQGNTLNNVAYGDGTYVAIGDYGTIVSSVGIADWKTQASATQTALSGIAYGTNTFVVVGDSGTILTSGNGSNWTSQTSGISQHLFDVAFGSNTFVAVGQFGLILSSTDHIHWVISVPATNGNISLYGVTYANGIFVAVGANYGGSLQSPIVVSADGVNWDFQNTGNTIEVRDVTYGNGTFVAAGRDLFTSQTTILKSTNGRDWNTQALTASDRPSGIAYGGGIFTVVNESQSTFTSSDTINWTANPVFTGTSPRGINYGGSFFVSVGFAGRIYLSNDGANWSGAESSVTDQHLNSIAYGPGGWVAVGQDGVVLSFTEPDFSVVSNVRITCGNWFGNTLRGIIYDQGVFVTVGDNGLIITATNGWFWRTSATPTPKNLYGISYGNGTFVAVGNDGIVLTSEDSVNWISRNSGTGSHLRDVTFANGLFVAVGFDQTILTSSNGISWTIRDQDFNGLHFYGVAYGNGRFVVVGEGTQISADGVNWIYVSSPDTFISVTYAYGYFVAVPWPYGRPAIFTTSDATNWVGRRELTSSANGVAAGNGLFTVVGDNGILHQSHAVAGNVSPRASNVLLVVNDRDAGVGSFRQAILDANANPGTDIIHFSIGIGLISIRLTSPLPEITDSLVIDGTSQPGFSGIPVVELNGVDAGVNASGLILSAGNCFIKGLIINRFDSFGIALSTGGTNIIEGNFVGTDSSGTIALGNRFGGILVETPENIIGGLTSTARNVVSGNYGVGIRFAGVNASNNIAQGNIVGLQMTGDAPLANTAGGIFLDHAPDNKIGGSSPRAGNIISGNREAGIVIVGVEAASNTVQGNYIGTNPDTLGLGNYNYGIFINDAPRNTIGGQTYEAANIISGNDGDGIHIEGISGNAVGNVVQGNYIGSDRDAHSLGNRLAGIVVYASSNVIGGALPGAQNVISDNGNDGILISANGMNNLVQQNIIAYNRGNGVTIQTGSRNAVRSNLFYYNGGLGIDLGANGPTCNDEKDPDSGANRLQNYPTLLSALYSGTNLVIQGSLNSSRNATFDVEFYESFVCNASGYGEGEYYLGASKINTDALGNASFSITLRKTILSNSYITATATDADGNTSEFCQCVEASATNFVQNAEKAAIDVSWESASSSFKHNSDTAGWEFIVLSPVKVTKLGLFDFNQDGFQQSHQTGIWNTNGLLLVQTTFASGTGAELIDGFRYLPVAGAVLQPGHYIIGTYFVNAGPDKILDSPSLVILPPEIAFYQSRYGAGTQFTFPNVGQGVGNGTNTFGPNFRFIEAEPSMAVSLVATNVYLEWPSSSAVFRLEATANLSPPIHWSAVTNSPTLVGGQYRLTLPRTNGNQFFRLVNP